MKQMIKVTLVGVLSLFVGLILGARLTDRYAETAVSLQRANQLSIDLKTADSLHNGDTNLALSILVGQIDENVVMLAAERNQIIYETNLMAVFRFAQGYRGKNAWMQAFEPTNSEITRRIQSLIASPNSPKTGPAS